MERGFIKQEDINCQCQCHFPSHIVCHITHCCHCSGNYENNNSIHLSPSCANRSSYINKDKEQNNMNMMSSYSTYYRSENDSIDFQNSGRNNFSASNSNNYYSRRKLQNQELRQSQLQKNFTQPNVNINNNNEAKIDNYSNIIHQEPYRNTNDNFYKNNNYNHNNSIIMNESLNPITQSNIKRNEINIDNNVINNNLTYNYKDNNIDNQNIKNLNKSSISNNTLPNDNLNIINSSPQPNYINPLDLSYISHNNNIDQLKSDLVKAHDIISILQRENDFLKSQRDGALNQISANENIKNIDRVKFDELQNENNELRQKLDAEINQNKIKDNYIADLKDELNDLHKVIHDKDREIQNLIGNMKKLEQDANNEINRLKNKIDDLNREKENIIRDFQKEINDLNEELRHLNNLLEDEKRKVRELENKIRTMKRFDEKQQELLNNLFNWYNTINKLLNTNTATGKAPPKESLKDVLNLQTADEFKDKLNQIEEKLKQFIDDMKLKFGECFACDIACCTSEVDRLKYFRKYYPGPPRDYLEGKRKCKCV